tara:strand:+ start:72770 stop:73837 length:1068 start_codon:yes stop_codon:yes gene_type:complete
MITVNTSQHRYPIYVDAGLLQQAELFTKHISGQQVMIVTNETVAKHYLSVLQASLSSFQVETVIVPDGEAFKTLATLETIWDALMKAKFNRQASLIALGGGVIGDMTGFAASCYQRGVHFLQVPTTLLAQVDASVGGKTAVNHVRGKNMIGAFYQPQAVIIDIDTLVTLPPQQFAAGMAEVVKHGLIKDAAYFAEVEQQADAALQQEPALLKGLIRRSCEIKAAVVSADEREAGERMLLNFGHTFAHAIETLTDYQQYLHGEAVAIGMVLAAKLSQQLGLLDAMDVNRIQQVLAKLQLPTALPTSLSSDAMIQAMRHDKKVNDKGLRFIVLNAIGDAKIVDNIDIDMIAHVLEDR